MDSKISPLVSFIGFLIFLIGIYASIRTAVNFAVFKTYPQDGVLSVNFPGLPGYYPGSINQREEDCEYIDPYSYPDINSEQRQAQKERCKQGVKESREQAKRADIANSVFYLFIGGVILLLHKRVIK